MKIGPNITTSKYYTQNNNNGYKRNTLNSLQSDTVEFSSKFKPDSKKPASNGNRALAFKGMFDDLMARFYGEDVINKKNDEIERRKHNNNLNTLLYLYERDKDLISQQEKAVYQKQIIKDIDSPLFDMSMIDSDYDGEFKSFMKMENLLKQSLANELIDENIQGLLSDIPKQQIDEAINMFSESNGLRDTLLELLHNEAKPELVEMSDENADYSMNAVNDDEIDEENSIDNATDNLNEISEKEGLMNLESDDFIYMIDKYAEIESGMLDDKNVSNEKEINDKATILADLFKHTISHSKFSDKELADGIDKILSLDIKNKEQIAKYTLEQINSLDIKASAILKMLATDIRRIEISEEELPDLQKELLQQYLSDRPEIEEGVCSMEEFNKLFKKEDRKPFLDGYFTTEINDHGETLFDIMLGIPCETDEDKKLKREVLKSIKDSESAQWNYVDKNGNTPAMKAALAEDAIVLKFLIDKKVDLSKKNSYGKTVFDIIKESNNPKLKKITKDLKIHSDEIIEVTKSGNLSLFKMISKNDSIDINSRDVNGFTPWLLAAKNGAVNIAEQLMTRDDVDFNALTDSHEDFINIAIKYKNSYFLKKVLPTYLSINKDAINRINEFVQFDALSDSVSEHMLEDCLNIDGVNPNLSLNDGSYTRPIAPITFRLLSKLRNLFGSHVKLLMYKLEKLAQSGKLDVSVKYEGLTLFKLAENIENKYVKKEVLEILNKAAESQIIQQVKDRIKQDGYLSMQNIKEFLASPNIEKSIYKPLSDNGETIAHYLAEIPVDENNYKDILNAAQKIQELDHNAFENIDKYNQSPLHKIIMSGNEILLEFYLQQSSADISAVEEIAESFDNPEINNLIKYYKNKK